VLTLQRMCFITPLGQTMCLLAQKELRVLG